MLITLHDGRQVDTGDILFDPASLQSQTPPVFTFIPTGENLDNQIRGPDMLDFPGFDQTAWNNYRYTLTYESQHSGQAPPPIGSTSTLGNFVDQVTTNPLQAPIESLNAGVKQIFSSSGVVTLGLIAAGLVIALLVLRDL
jgi:hypothetical protein